MEVNEHLNDLNENEEIKLINEYSKLSREELKNIITKKNQELIFLYEQKEKSINRLNLMIENLNKIISNNSNILYKIEPDPYIIKQLERIIDLRKRDLNSSKKINNTFKLQYEKMSNRIENLFSPRKINTFETQINYLKKENHNINSKIRVLKEKNILNVKKIENLKDKKKYSAKIKSYIEEIKSLGSKKLDYFIKINSNKRSLENILKEKEILFKLYNSNINEEIDEGILSKIKYWLNLIKSDLEGTEEEIFHKVETDNSKIIKETEKYLFKHINKNPLFIPNKKQNTERAKSFNLNNNNKNNMKINTHYQGIFTKYSLLQRKTNNKSQPRYMLNINNKENDLKNNKIEDLNFEYELTSNNDYNELLNKKQEYVEMVNRLEKTMQEVKKISNKKTENIYYSVNDNSRKLNNLKQQNLLIQNEINDLEKVYQLTLEQFEINKELKTKENNENNIENNKINNEKEKENENNDNNNTKFVVEEDENKKNIDLKNLNTNENEQNKTNINQRNNELKEGISDEDNNNKNYSIENIFNKDEKIKEEDILINKKKKNLSREKRLEEIKLKYLEMENEEKRLKDEEIKKNNEENEINEEEFEGIVEDHLNEEDENNEEENENNEDENNEEEDENNEEEFEEN